MKLNKLVCVSSYQIIDSALRAAHRFSNRRPLRDRHRLPRRTTTRLAATRRRPLCGAISPCSTGDRLPTARHRAGAGTDGRPLARPDGRDPEPGQPARFETLRAPVAAVSAERVREHDEVACSARPTSSGTRSTRRAPTTAGPPTTPRPTFRLHDVRRREVPLRAAASNLFLYPRLRDGVDVDETSSSVGHSTTSPATGFASMAFGTSSGSPVASPREYSYPTVHATAAPP